MTTLGPSSFWYCVSMNSISFSTGLGCSTGSGSGAMTGAGSGVVFLCCCFFAVSAASFFLFLRFFQKNKKRQSMLQFLYKFYQILTKAKRDETKNV